MISAQTPDIAPPARGLSSEACRFPADAINAAPHATIAALKRNPLIVTPPSKKEVFSVIRSPRACKLHITTSLTRYLRCFGASYSINVMTTSGHAMSAMPPKGAMARPAGDVWSPHHVLQSLRSNSDQSAVGRALMSLRLKTALDFRLRAHAPARMWPCQ